MHDVIRRPDSSARRIAGVGHLERGQVALSQMRRYWEPRHPHQSLDPMREMKARHVAEGRHAHPLGIGEAGAELERAEQRQAGEVIDEQV